MSEVRYQDGGFGGHLMGGGEFGASARRATKDLQIIFVVVICLFFTFHMESESSFVSTSLVISGIIFSS